MKKKDDRWISMSDESAREKVGHCLRDMIASQRDNKKGKKSKGTEPPPIPGGMNAPLSPMGGNNPWIEGVAKDISGFPSLHPTRGVASVREPTTNRFTLAPKSPISSQTNPHGPPSAFHHQMPPLSGMIPGGPGMLGPDPSSVPLNLNNLDTVTLQKGNLQDMSNQQRQILMKLEGGF